MKHRESEQTQLRVSRLLNRDSVMLHAEIGRASCRERV